MLGHEGKTQKTLVHGVEKKQSGFSVERDPGAPPLSIARCGLNKGCSNINKYKYCNINRVCSLILILLHGLQFRSVHISHSQFFSCCGSNPVMFGNH